MQKNFDKTYLKDPKYTSVLVTIMAKTGRVREEGNETISWGGNCTKNEIPEINLNYSMITSKSKWEKSIERAKEGKWVL